MTMIRSHLVLLLVSILILPGLFGCVDELSPGTLTNETASPDSFVTEDLVVFAATDDRGDGLRQIQLDGSDRLELFTEEYRFHDVSADRSTWVVIDSAGRAQIVKDGQQLPLTISGLNFRVSAARISPDVQTIAAVRPRSLTGSGEDQSWQGDDSIYLVDIETLEVEVRDPVHDDINVSRLRWSKEGDALYYQVQPGSITMRLDVESDERVELQESWDGLSEEFFTVPTQAKRSCPHNSGRLDRFTDGDTIGIRIRGRGPTRALVEFEGYNYPRHHQGRLFFESYFFSESCDYVIFAHDRSIWVVETRSGITGRLMPGYKPFLLGSSEE